MKNKLLFKNNQDLIPAIIQESTSGEILMLGYMNTEAFKKTLKEKNVYFWSRKRNKLWKKGEISGNEFKVVEIYNDCDGDTLLIKVDLIGKYACHKGFKSCFYKKII